MPAAFDPYYTWLGIPPEEQPADFYRLLGLKRFEENRDVISNAADQRLAHIRSFQSGQHMRESQRVLNELSKASGCLLNPRRKAMYDQHLRSSEVSGKQAAELSAPDDGNEFSIRIEPIRGGAASPPRRSKRQTSSSVRSKAISLALGGIAVVAIAAMITILVGRYRHTSEQALSNIVPDVTKSAAASDLQSNSSTDSSPTKNPSTLSNQNKSENTTAGSVVASATQAAVADSESSVADTSTTAPTASSDVGKGQATETSSTPDQQAANTKGQTVAEAAGTPASGETSPAPALPGQPKALRFNGSDRVVLTNSQGLVDLKRPLTVEMWVRFQPGDIGHWLCGDLIIGGKHAAVPPGAVAGWQLFIQQTAAARHRVAVSTRDGYAHDFPVTENRWHHLAFCSDTKVATIYVDGRQTATGPLELLVRTFVPSPIPLQIGSHEHLDSRQQPAGLKGDLKGFRISSTARYTSEFTPSLSLGSDSATEVLLDFEKATAERIADLSGHGRDGQIVGARWVALENWPQAADLASTTPPASVPAPAVPVPVANPTQEPVDAPGAEAIATAAAHVRELFKAELAAAKDAKQKLQFADKLLSLAAESQDDPATRYAMLEQAHKLAIQAHDVRKALAIDTQIARNFRLDELARKVATAKEAADTAKTTVDRKSVAELGISLADDLVEEGRFDEATATIQLSIAQAGRAKETELAKAAREFRDEINQAKRAFTDVQTAKTALEANPDDPEANLRWGRFLCFYQQRWADGLQHLAKSNHEVLAEIARLDLKMPQSGEDQAALAKSWAEAIKAVETAERNSAAFRAWDWSRKANAQLKGLAKVENEKQMKELESQIPSRYRTTLVKNSKPSSNASPFQPPREFVGLLGRVQVAGRDAGILWKYESGLRLTHQQILDVLGQANIPQGRIRIEMVGFLTVLEPTTVNVALDGGSAAGTVTLFVDNQPIGEVGGMRPVSDVYKVDLNPGEHAIRWVLHGDTLGTCSLGFTNSATAQPLAVYHNPQLLTIVRDSPTRARLNVNMLRNQ